MTIRHRDAGGPSCRWRLRERLKFFLLFVLQFIKCHETREDKSVRVIKDTEVYSVDPVFIGAGVNTRTAAVKSSMPFSEHVEQQTLYPTPYT
jgi:hypothetical protein